MPATSPPDLANLLVKGDVEAALTWETMTTQLTQSGAGAIVVTQQQLWEQTFGMHESEVSVAYLARPDVAQQYPRLLRDINTGQARVAELWRQGDSRVVEPMMQVTRLPEEVIREAFGRTTPLSGLSDQSVDVIRRQLQFNREHGTILQSDVWIDDPGGASREMFVQVG